jgi:hypothetical protein
MTPLLSNGLRNEYKWPFASDSIWNAPIGSGARYVPAGIAVATAMGMTVDEDVIVQRADAPLKPVVVNDAGWDSARTRCGSLKGGTVTSPYRFPDENIGIGAGIAGAHGASGGVIRHALKINVFGRKNYHYDARESAPGYRWPAKSADGYAGDPKSSRAYGGGVPAMRIGSLMALRPDFSIEALRTEPAKGLARALVDYGAHTVDDTCWDVYGLTTEWGPDGRIVDEFR